MMNYALKDTLQASFSGEWGNDCISGEGVAVLRTTNFTNVGDISYCNVVERDITDGKIQKKKLQVGDIILEKSGGTKNTPVGRVVYFDRADKIYLCNNFTQVLRPNSQIVDGKYLFYCLYAKYQFHVTDGLYNKTTGIQNLQMDRYFNLQIPVVDKEQQYKICKQLDALRAAIEKKKQVLRKFDDLVKSQFIEMFEHRDIATIKIGSVLETTSGGTPSKSNMEYYENGEIPWMTSGEVSQGLIFDVKNRITEKGLKNSSAKWMPQDTVVVAMYGATAGQVGLLKIKTTTNQAVCGILPNGRFNALYLYHAVSRKKEWMISQCAGGAQPNISQTVIKRMEILEPPIDDQEQFAAFVEQTDKSKIPFELEVAA